MFVFWAVCLLIIVLIIHELGHFVVARLLNVKVKTFSIGIGKALLKWTNKSGTVIKISPILLGAYVEFLGETEGIKLTEEEKKLTFDEQPLKNKILIILAGPLANLLVGIFIFITFYGIIGVQTYIPVIKDSQIEGIGAGDVIYSVAGKRVETWEDISNILLQYKIKNKDSFSVSFSFIDNQKTQKDKEILLNINNSKITFPFTIDNNNTLIQRFGLVKSFSLTFMKTKSLLHLFGNIIVNVSDYSNNITGFVGVIDGTQKIIHKGFREVFFFFGIMNSVFFASNMLPIPIFDGGQIIFFTLTKIFKNIPKFLINLYIYIGLAFLLGIIFYSFWLDIVRYLK